MARALRFDGLVAYVPLTKGFEAIIDAADAAEVGRFNWNYEPRPGGLQYASRWRHASERPGSSHIYLHQFLTGWARVDHRDGDGLRCRRENLRPCTHAENMRNRRGKKGRSLPKGVYPRGRRFYSTIKAGPKIHQLGVFDTIAEAQTAYAAASARLHGEFGCAA